jgi:NitT/TauT family transport system permease protein
VLFLIRFPIALPAIFAGTKVAISMALVGVIVGEFVTSTQGLGFVIMYAQGTFDAPMVYASILLLGILGTALFYLVDFIERLSIPWHVSHRVPDASSAQVPV